MLACVFLFGIRRQFASTSPGLLLVFCCSGSLNPPIPLPPLSTNLDSMAVFQSPQQHSFYSLSSLILSLAHQRISSFCFYLLYEMECKTSAHWPHMCLTRRHFGSRLDGCTFHFHCKDSVNSFYGQYNISEEAAHEHEHINSWLLDPLPSWFVWGCSQPWE